MTAKTIPAFFRRLSRYYPRDLRVTLVGGAAALLQGTVRSTRDIDFEIALRGARKDAGLLESALERARAELSIEIQYSEDWDRTSSIARPRRSPRPIPWTRFGKTRVFLMHPLPWSVGKLTRYLNTDVSDLATVFRNRASALGITPSQCADYWGRALGESPLSETQSLFKHQVADFLRNQGPKIWGRSYRCDPWIRRFQAAARRAVR